MNFIKSSSIISIIAASVIFAPPALAQNRDGPILAGQKRATVCADRMAREYFGPVEMTVPERANSFFHSDGSPKSNAFPDNEKIPNQWNQRSMRCYYFSNNEAASQYVSKESRGMFFGDKKINFESADSFSSEKRYLPFLYLDTGPAVPRGYRSASIKLDYRFLVCAGEVQIAYSLDRRSLEHDKLYDIRLKGGKISSSEPEREPSAPTTIPIDLSINSGIAVNIIAHIKDDIAGEALGMGCFTGQTKTIGTVAKLIAPNATPAQAKLFLNKLRATHRFTNQHLPFPLLNDAVPIPANAVPVTK